MARVTPKSLVLDLLRVTPRPVEVRRLIEVGELFGLQPSAVRVALSRLARRGLVESDERGSYRLAPRAGVVSRLVDAWRRGDGRTRRWCGGWLCVHHPRGGGRSVRRRSQRALARFGFREGLEGLWVRPDNLRAARASIVADLAELGLMPGAETFVGRGFAAATEAGLRGTLWPLARLRAGWSDALAALERSRGRLRALPPGEALVESFLVGGEAIRVLATDPLLPDEILDGAERRALGEAMRSYDGLGKTIWKSYLEAPALRGAPSHLAAAVR